MRCGAPPPLPPLPLRDFNDYGEGPETSPGKSALQSRSLFFRATAEDIKSCGPAAAAAAAAAHGHVGVNDNVYMHARGGGGDGLGQRE